MEDEEEKNKYKKVLQIPYVQPMFNKIKNVFKNLDIRIVFENNNNVKRWLENYKYSEVDEKIDNVIYQIDCICGKMYIGETGDPWNRERKSTEPM